MKTMEKLFAKNYGIIARKHGYKYSQLSAFKVEKDFFFSAFIHLNNLAVIKNYLEIYVSLNAKPFKIDDLFWEIFNLIENKKKPLSFRANGAFVVRGPALLERQTVTFTDLIPSEENMVKIIDKGIELTNDTIKDFLEKWTIETFDVNNFKFPGMTNDKMLMEMLLKILDGDYKEALALVNNEIYKNETGRYLNSDGTSIYDMVKKYCEGEI